MIPGGREQRTVFGEVPESYDRARPGYPSELIDGIVARTGMKSGDRVLEVGSGTGKATALLAGAGWDVLCVEPSEPMAEVARRRFAEMTNVHIETVGFEEWDPSGRRFDVLACAQAWHWLDPAVRFVKAADVLAPNGWLALIWNDSQDGTGALRRAMDEAYRRHAPALAGVPSTQASTVEAAGGDIEASGLFGPVEVLELPGSTTMATERYIELLTTHSNHRLLPEHQRDRLLAAVADAIDAHGGSIPIDYVTRTFLAQRRPA